MSALPAARVGDPIAHTMALPGAVMGLLAGAAIGAFIIATGGLGAIAVGAALATAGGMGLAGQYIGSAIMGPPTGAITIGSPNVLINLRPASATVIGIAACAKEPAPIPEAEGSATVLINTMPAGREGEKFVCSAIVLKGSPDVLIGGATQQVLPIEPEVPGWLSATMQAMTWGGLIIATGGSIATVGLGATLGYGALGFGGSMVGSWAGRQLGDALGLSEGATRALEVGGGFLGGAGAVKGGQWFNRNYRISVDPNRLGSNGGNIRITPKNAGGGGAKPPKMTQAQRQAVFKNHNGRISQKQMRHIKDRPEWQQRGQGSYVNSMDDAQTVLNNAKAGTSDVLGTTNNGVVVRDPSVTGYNNNPGAGYIDQPTNVFIIKGTAKPSVVPTNPNWTP